MKHLKLFENSNNAIWIVVGEDLRDPDNNHHDLFDNETSAEKFFLNMINDEKEIFFENKEKPFTDSDLILTVEKAREWAEDNSYDYRWYFYKTYVESNFELPERLKTAIIESKYNL